MNLWNVRHQGSPQSVDGLTADDVIDGVKEGIWETSDEVMGPDDVDWVPLEQHPVFAAAPWPTTSRRRPSTTRTRRGWT